MLISIFSQYLLKNGYNIDVKNIIKGGNNLIIDTYYKYESKSILQAA